MPSNPLSNAFELDLDKILSPVMSFFAAIILATYLFLDGLSILFSYHGYP
jgi:hypothetical protein